MSWLENLKKLKEESKKTIGEIAKGTNQPERTIIRIFRGETEHPTISTLIPIVNFLNGSLDEIFSDTTAFVGNKNLATLQAEKERLVAQNTMLKEKTNAQELEIALLKKDLMYTKELLSVHRFYDTIND